MSEEPQLRFTGHAHLAQRLVLSTLTGRPIRISRIRDSDPQAPGLAPHEVSLLRVLEAITNGGDIQISYTGTTLAYRPGLVVGTSPQHLIGGAGGGYGVGGGGGFSSGDDTLEMTLPATVNRGITYFLAPLCMLAPFAKGPVNVRFTGQGVITAATPAAMGGDVSVDTFRTAVLPCLDAFGIPVSAGRVELRVLKRACAGVKGRGGGGEVELRFAGQVRLPKTLHLHRDPGKVRRVRGVAYCTGVAASNAGRMMQAAREVLSPVVGDVHVAVQYDPAPTVAVGDGQKGKQSAGERRRVGLGFGLSLVAESSAQGVYYSADAVSPAEGGGVPEDVGRDCALQLLEVVARGGCVGGNGGTVGATTVLTLMAMGSEDVGRVRVSRQVMATEAVVALAMDLKSFGAASWAFRDAPDDRSAAEDDGDGDEEDEDDPEERVDGPSRLPDLIISVKGTGVGNVSRKIA